MKQEYGEQVSITEETATELNPNRLLQIKILSKSA